MGKDLDMENFLAIEKVIGREIIDSRGNPTVEAEVYLLHYKRPEMRFDGIEALKAQMATDIAKGREYHGLA